MNCNHQIWTNHEHLVWDCQPVTLTHFQGHNIPVNTLQHHPKVTHFAIIILYTHLCGGGHKAFRPPAGILKMYVLQKWHFKFTDTNDRVFIIHIQVLARFLTLLSHSHIKVKCVVDMSEMNKSVLIERCSALCSEKIAQSCHL